MSDWMATKRPSRWPPWPKSTGLPWSVWAPSARAGVTSIRGAARGTPNLNLTDLLGVAVVFLEPNAGRQLLPEAGAQRLL
jgi:hypothetical protein